MITILIICDIININIYYYYKHSTSLAILKHPEHFYINDEIYVDI